MRFLTFLNLAVLFQLLQKRFHIFWQWRFNRCVLPGADLEMLSYENEGPTCL